ncbi:hypothetical protein [Lederbergia citrea]|uniref:hypothetical protein n=1 Tax=Lederbergia citrea TaxID=2833581 RepID=UPI001BC9A06C|nr:hypothetical protein [Lederbergia citrea]MBS4176308.1 hypothetical protein [Lederbergia citrea]MBS4202869.1 hypothetical protein [Lederbergia citrea]
MNDSRKKVILKEINFWKQNNMLPEQYCNYLIALYSEGDAQQQPKIKKRNMIYSNELLFSLLYLIIIAIAIVITYITDFSFGLQTLFLSILGVILLLSLYYYRRKKKNQLVINITGAFLVLLYTVQLNEAFFENNASTLYIMLFVNCLVWIVIGIWRKQPFFIIAGAIAITALLFLFFSGDKFLFYLR